MSEYVCNTISLQMLKLLDCFKLNGIRISESQFNAMTKQAKSFVGHKSAADEMGVEYNRDDLILKSGDILYVRQIAGKRLPEGVNTLPENVELQYWQIILQ